MSQETQITPEIALSNLVVIYKQTRLTPEEHDVMRVSIQVLLDLIQKDRLVSSKPEDASKNTN